MKKRKIRLTIILATITTVSFFVKNSAQNLVFAEENGNDIREVKNSQTSPKIGETISISIKNTGDIISGTISLITPDSFDFIITPNSGSHLPQSIIYSGTNQVVYTWTFSGQQTGIQLSRSGLLKKSAETNFSINIETRRNSGKQRTKTIPFTIKDSIIKPFVIYETSTGDKAETKAILSGYDPETQTIFNNNHSPIKVIENEKIFFFQLLDQSGKLSLIPVQNKQMSENSIPTTPEKGVISYSISKPTNQPVKVEFSLTGATIINNSGSFFYTFKENGIFTFIYKDQYNNTGSEIAKVSRIDTRPIKARVIQNQTKRTTSPVSIRIVLSKPGTLYYKKNFYSGSFINLPPITENEISNISFFDEAGNSGKVEIIVGNIVPPAKKSIGFPESVIGAENILPKESPKREEIVEEKKDTEKEMTPIIQTNSGKVEKTPTPEIAKILRLCDRSFEDIENSFYKRQIRILAQYCIVQGRSEKSYKPNNFVKTQDFIKIITNTEIVKKIGYLPEKIDYSKSALNQLFQQQVTKELGLKLTSEISVDQAKQIINIFKKVQPESNIIELPMGTIGSPRLTKAQAADLIVRAFQLEEPDLSLE
ncbi:MAG TPA: hypothetical protein PKC14_02925 [Candidatus Absconditabacterales bacterium]|nr:hypothetical protein [Candidatus Absconditabacterales bacterium]